MCLDMTNFVVIATFLLVYVHASQNYIIWEAQTRGSIDVTIFHQLFNNSVTGMQVFKKRQK